MFNRILIQCIAIYISIFGACAQPALGSSLATPSKVDEKPERVELSIGGQTALAKDALCGPLCLYMALRLTGNAKPLDRVIVATPNLSAINGCTLRDLEAAGISMGGQMHCALFDVDHLENYSYPVIVYTKYTHFVVLTHPSQNRIVMFDPTKKEGWTITVDQLREFATPYALVSGVNQSPVMVSQSRLGGECGLAFLSGLFIAGACLLPFGRYLGRGTKHESRIT